MKSKLAFIVATAHLASLAACLGPPDEAVPLSRRLGPVGFDIADAPLLEDAGLTGVDPAAFTKTVVRLRGYADHRPLNYWNVDGANSDLIAPAYFVVGADGAQVGRPIIDVAPGEAGYTPWWRKTVVRVTEKYAGEAIWSRDAVEAAVQAGLLLEPQPTAEILSAPVTLQGTTVPLNDANDTATAGTIWYRGYRTHWVVFSGGIELELTARKMPVYPVYLLQRIDEAAPLYEFLSGVDMDGDDLLVNSNNIFAADLGKARYSPLWSAKLVRVRREYPSIDTASVAVGLSAERDFLDGSDNVISDLVVGSPQELGLLVNCPIQPAEGGL
jgi:hypothetical protein